MQRDGRRQGAPAVAEFGPHVLQKGVAHVVHREDVAVRVRVGGGPHGAEDGGAVLPTFFAGFAQRDDFGAFGARHGGLWMVVVL